MLARSTCTSESIRWKVWPDIGRVTFPRGAPIGFCDVDVIVALYSSCVHVGAEGCMHIKDKPSEVLLSRRRDNLAATCVFVTQYRRLKTYHSPCSVL